MTENSKPLLSNHLRNLLASKFGSLTDAASQLNVPYERLKKAFQKNKFREEDLLKLLPEQNLEEVQSIFAFALARPYRGGTRKGWLPPSPKFQLEGLEESDIAFLKANKAVAERITRLVKDECAKWRQAFSTD